MRIVAQVSDVAKWPLQWHEVCKANNKSNGKAFSGMKTVGSFSLIRCFTRPDDLTENQEVRIDI